MLCWLFKFIDMFVDSVFSLLIFGDWVRVSDLVWCCGLYKVLHVLLFNIDYACRFCYYFVTFRFVRNLLLCWVVLGLMLGGFGVGILVVSGCEFWVFSGCEFLWFCCFRGRNCADRG